MQKDSIVETLLALYCYLKQPYFVDSAELT